jgi:diamine N-acetyltransferase
MAVRLREITEDNFGECLRLKVAEEQQGFVAPTIYSLAESSVHADWVPLAIYDEDTMVGFIMYGPNPWYIIRLLVDQQHQGRGYGRAAMTEAIRRIKEQPDCREIYTSYEPDNEVAARLYESLGFVPTGEIDEGEIVVRLVVTETD